jgi:hypothetical protein
MSGSELDAYLAGIDARAVAIARALDDAVAGACPNFDVAVKYRILMYTLAGDWRTWVCAIDARKNGVCLRFLYGVLLDDPRDVLRAGSSVLRTWDFAFDDVVDPTAVGTYVAEAVAEAVARYDDYRANTREVLDATQAAAKAGRQPKTSG